MIKLINAERNKNISISYISFIGSTIDFPFGTTININKRKDRDYLFIAIITTPNGDKLKFEFTRDSAYQIEIKD